MSPAERERRILAEMEAGLAKVSYRPCWSDVVAAAAAHRLLLIVVVAVVVALATGATDANLAGILVAGIFSAAAIVGTAALLWRDARMRSAGD